MITNEVMGRSCVGQLVKRTVTHGANQSREKTKPL